MPSSGLSLVGFMDETSAMNHLRIACIPPDASDTAIRSAWQGAQAGCAVSTKNAGMPAISPIPASHSGYIAALTQTPMFTQAQSHIAGASFQMIEIAPLFAFQHTVDLDHIAQQCGGLSNPPTIDELMTLCLPTAAPAIPAISMSPAPHSILVKTRALNLTALGGVIFQNPNQPFVAGAAIGPALPLVHVVRLGGHCYLSNGFHRAVGARMAGATEMPCLFRDVVHEDAVGIRQDGSTFSSADFKKANPPTVGHFTISNAHKVQLRARSRILHFSWGEHIAYDE